MSLINSLVAFWKFEESSSTAIDVSGNGHDVTWNVSGRTPPGGAPQVFTEPQRATGVVNYGVNLNDSYLWADYADWNVLADTSFTWAGQVKPPSSGAITNDNDVVLSLLGEYE